MRSKSCIVEFILKPNPKYGTYLIVNDGLVLFCEMKYCFRSAF